jgi:hypothetical protein
MFKNLEPVPVVIFLLNVSKHPGTGEFVEFLIFWGSREPEVITRSKNHPTLGDLPGGIKEMKTVIIACGARGTILGRAVGRRRTALYLGYCGPW